MDCLTQTSDKYVRRAIHNELLCFINAVAIVAQAQAQAQVHTRWVFTFPPRDGWASQIEGIGSPYERRTSPTSGVALWPWFAGQKEAHGEGHPRPYATKMQLALCRGTPKLLPVLSARANWLGCCLVFAQVFGHVYRWSGFPQGLAFCLYWEDSGWIEVFL